jgi:uncharacterized membrane protein (Fun14 family)
LCKAVHPQNYRLESVVITAQMLSTILKPRLAMVAVSVVGLSFPNVLCEKIDDRSNKISGNSWLDKFSKTGKIAVEANLPQEEMFSNETAREASMLIHEYFGNAPAKVGYGFIMGYSAGFFVKRTSKVIAFAVGGVFALVQTLAYNGYIVVNHDKLKADTEGLLDLNNDGKLDQDDVKFAFDKVTFVQFSILVSDCLL